MLRDGEARLVPDADSAEVIVLIGSRRLHQRRRGRRRAIEPFETMDRTRRFARVRADGGEPLGGDCFAAGDRVATALATETVGVAQKAMEMAVEYARDRKQFGRPIGSYQAVSPLRRCCWRSSPAQPRTTRAGAPTPSRSRWRRPPRWRGVLVRCRWRVCGSSLQVHGGIGFTWGHDLHFYLKRAKTNAMLFGSAREHRERVAELTLEQPATIAG